MTGNTVELPERMTFAKVKALEIDAEQIIRLFQTGDGRAVTFRGIPSDARAVGIRGMEKFGKIVLLVESSEFPVVDVSEGAPLPSLDVEARTVLFRSAEKEHRCPECGGPTYESDNTGVTMRMCDACQRAYEVEG
jgi:hypothetical protein